MPEGGKYYGRDEYLPHSRDRDEREDHRDRDRNRDRDRERDRDRARNTRDQRYRDQRDPGYLDRIDSDHLDRQRNGGNDRAAFSHRDAHDYREPRHHKGRPAHYKEEMYSEDTSMPPEEIIEYEPEPSNGLYDCYNFRYILTWRGLCHVMEVLLNLLIIICVGVSYSASGVYRDLASLGGLYAYYFGGANAFTGAEADRVKALDAQFYQLKLPIYVASMALGGAVMSYACLMLVLGVLRVPFRWPHVLVVEGILDALIGLGYLPALAFYFIKLQQAYDSPTCKERQTLYESKGHQGFGCTLNGGDIVGGLFGVLGAVIFPLSAVLAFRAFRTVWELKKKPPQHLQL